MGDRRFAWVFALFSAAALVSAIAAPVRAQDALRPSAGSFPTTRTAPTRTPPLPQAADEADVAPDIAPPIPVDDFDRETGEAQEDLDGLQPVPRIGQRVSPTDGDLSATAEPPAPQDGVVDVGEPLPPQDGGDAGLIDTRTPEDIALFEDAPVAEIDPLLFQIEDLDPVRDNRTTARLASLEPYDPVGIRIGSFVLFPVLESGGSYTSNVFRSPDARSDIAAELAPTARLVSNWSRHALEFRGAGDFSFYDENDSENDRTYAFESRGRLDVTRRTNLQALLSYDSSLESRSAINASVAGTRTKITTERAEAALNHQFNRLSVQIRGSISDFAYGDTQNLGVTTSNSDRDYTQTEETLRATWEFKPTLSVFAEVAINQRDYDQAAQSDLINRTSDGQRYRAGVSFGNTGQILRGEVSLGYGAQSPDDARLRDIDGLILDANATWRVSDLTSVLFTARSDVTETNTANVSGALSRSAGVEVRHALRRYLVASAGLAYSNQDSQDGAIDDNEWRTTLGLEYFVSPEAIVFGNYAHTNFDGVGTDSDYDADEVRVGVRLRR